MTVFKCLFFKHISTKTDQHVSTLSHSTYSELSTTHVWSSNMQIIGMRRKRSFTLHRESRPIRRFEPSCCEVMLQTNAPLFVRANDKNFYSHLFLLTVLGPVFFYTFSLMQSSNFVVLAVVIPLHISSWS